MEGKIRNPDIVAYMKQLEVEFANYAKDHPSSILLNSKMQKFLALIDEKTISKCGKEVHELQQYARVEQKDGKYSIVSNPGKEQETRTAIQNLDQCQSGISQYFTGLNTFSQYNLAIISGSVENCIDECEKNIPNTKSEEMRTCVRNCYDFTFKYTLKTIEDMLSQQIDAASEELKKI